MIPTARLPCGAPTRWCRRPASPGWSSTPSWSLKACSVPAWPAWHPATRCTWKAPYGFLTLERFAPGGDLWLLASGTGLSAYLSILRDPAVWNAYRRIILVHGVRTAEELAYREEIESLARRPDRQPLRRRSA